MTYNDKMKEVEQTTFIELYKFESGENLYRYTSSDEPVGSFLGEYYEPGLIKRSGFNIDKSFKAISLTITARLSSPLQEYIANTPIEPVRLTIYRVFVDDLTDYAIIFKGVVKKLTIKNQMISANCETLSDIFRQKLPKTLYQGFCNNVLFDSVCGLTEATYKADAVIVISGSDLTSATFATFANDYFMGGYVIFEGDCRLITAHSAATITLQVPFDSRLTTGDTVSSYPGCNKNPDTCKNKFTNFDNFVGFPYIPSKNPCLYGIR